MFAREFSRLLDGKYSCSHLKSDFGLFFEMWFTVYFLSKIGQLVFRMIHSLLSQFQLGVWIRLLECSRIAKTRKQPKCPSTEEWIKKMWYIYIVEYCSVVKKNEIMLFASLWMDLQGIKLSEPGQTEKHKRLYDITYMRNLKRYN